MRLDKFLKVSRLVKRRPVANELCDTGKVSLNGKVAKASQAVQVGNELAIRFGNRHLVVVIEMVPEKAVPVQEAPFLYRILSDEKIQPNSL